MSRQSPCSRAATLTVSPMTVNSWRSGAPTAPATTSPACTAILVSRGGRPVVARTRFSSVSRSCMPSAQRSAAAAPPAGHSAFPVSKSPKTTSMASPMNLSTKPPHWRTHVVIVAKNSFRVRTTSSGASRSAIVVKLRRSQKSTVAGRSSPPRSTPPASR